jgi:CubicO group peptidase (beta-lactamase class C family)
MIIVNRREFSRMALALAATAPAVRASKSASNHIDDTLRVGMERRKIPAITAMVATPDKVTYQGAFGTRDADSGVKITMDSIFAIASMTKAITSTAALQLVDQGKLKLDEPVAKHIPEFAKLQVLDSFDPSGKPILRPVRTPVTLKHLLTHTSGFCYDTWSEEMIHYEKATGASAAGVAPLVPLLFEPGTRWQYGYGLDWTGRLVEIVSGLTLEEFFRHNILDPLGMNDTSFLVPSAKFDRLVTRYDRQADGSLKQVARSMPATPAAFNGGGGLYSTAGDYVKFMQMILRRGRGEGSVQILQAKTVAMMTSNQIGSLGAGKLKTQRPNVSSDVDVHPGAIDKWGLGFLINTVAYPGGRAAGSLAWAGIDNTFYWIDPKRQLCAVLMMQFLPFVDKDAVGMLGEFEKAVYAA